MQKSAKLALHALLMFGLIASLLSCASCSSVPPKPLVIYAATGTLQVGGDYCSATAVGPHTILTAAHCFEQKVVPQTFKFQDQDVTVTKAMEDAYDHVLLLTDHTFPGFATMESSSNKPKVGDDLYYWGTPGGLQHVMRKCYMAATIKGDLMMDCNVWFGDSGSGIFDKNGKVIGVVNYMRGDNTHLFRLAGVQPFGYTLQQWVEMGVPVDPQSFAAL